MATITLYHGTDHVIEVPSFSLGKSTNDYGRGFYCTRLPQMAMEWACKNGTDGFVNEYSFSDEGLKVLNLLDGKHTILNWIALLLAHRIFTVQDAIAKDAKEYIIEHFSIDTSAYDAVIGYRADDSYFSYAQSFISNTLPLRSLARALKLGKLGEQTVLVSQKAFRRIRFVKAEAADKEIYYPKFCARDSLARASFRDEIKNSRSYRDDLFVLDILREEIKNDDPRIQRIVLE